MTDLCESVQARARYLIAISLTFNRKQTLIENLIMFMKNPIKTSTCKAQWSISVFLMSCDLYAYHFDVLDILLF